MGHAVVYSCRHSHCIGLLPRKPRQFNHVRCAGSKRAPEPTEISTNPADAIASSVADRPFLWCNGIVTGTFSNEVKAVFPEVDWQPASLLKVLFFALPSAAGALAFNAQLQRLLSHSSNRPDMAADVHSIASTASGNLSVLDQALTASPLQQALLHVSQETVLAVALPLACYLALGSRVVVVKWDWYWVKQTLATCLVLFPLVEPAMWLLWQPAVQACLGQAPPSPYVEVLQAAAAAGSWSSIAWHCLASGVVGPLWEEVFWRGFILTALIKVLPVPVCVVFSSVNFAALHLSLYNFLPLMLLSASSDCLYLRSGGNLLPSLLLHGLWNVSQVLQISLLHKESFV